MKKRTLKRIENWIQMVAYILNISYDKANEIVKSSDTYNAALEDNKVILYDQDTAIVYDIIDNLNDIDKDDLIKRVSDAYQAVIIRKELV